jgi:hypothetical protein
MLTKINRRISAIIQGGAGHECMDQTAPSLALDGIHTHGNCKFRSEGIGRITGLDNLFAAIAAFPPSFERTLHVRSPLRAVH